MWNKETKDNSNILLFFLKNIFLYKKFLSFLYYVDEKNIFD